MTTSREQPGGPLQFLVGTWVGEGRGVYPTVAPFDFTEEVTFTAVATKPFLAYAQRTRHASEGRPLHAESGYWRWTDHGVEVVLAHAFGITEVLEGTVVDGVIDLASRQLVSSGTAKVVGATTRRFHAQGDELTYDVSMAAMGQPLTHHLHATLHRKA